jgi:hypothetical protein
MEAVVRNHPWPIRTPPIEGEILSSWMTRIATAHGVSLQCLCWETWPSSDVLMHDIDRRPPPGLIEKLARRTELPITRIQQMVLPSLVGRLLENLPSSSGWVQWVLPILLRTRVSHGIQYCPDCLAEEAEPHWRIDWRLAFVTTCPRHLRLLLDTCPSCGAAPNPLALFKEQRPSVEPAPVHQCRWCGYDYRGRYDGLDSSISPSKTAIQFEACLIQALREKWFDLRGYGLIHSIPFFRGLHLILTMLASKGQSGRLREAVHHHLDFEYPPTLVSGQSRRVLFERQNVSTRHQLITMAAWVTEDWPNHFTHACQDASLSGTRLTLELQRKAPYWYWKATGENLGSKRGRWRRAALPEGLNLSYASISHRLNSKKLQAQERRIRFVRDHPELWEDPLRLTGAMRCVGLYSPQSSLALLVPYCPVLIALAKGEGVIHRFTKSLAVCCVKGRRQLVLLPTDNPSHQ